MGRIFSGSLQGFKPKRIRGTQHFWARKKGEFCGLKRPTLWLQTSCNWKACFHQPVEPLEVDDGSPADLEVATEAWPNDGLALVPWLKVMSPKCPNGSGIVWIYVAGWGPVDPRHNVIVNMGWCSRMDLWAWRCNFRRSLVFHGTYTYIYFISLPFCTLIFLVPGIMALEGASDKNRGTWTRNRPFHRVTIHENRMK